MNCCGLLLSLSVSIGFVLPLWSNAVFCNERILAADPQRNTAGIMYNFVKEPIDVVIPCVDKDIDTINLCIEGIKQNCSQIRRVITVSARPITDKAEWFDETKFPFKMSEVALYLTNQNQEEARAFLTKRSSRCGWYYQQLLKLYAPFVIPGISSNVLILDSDTIFLNPVRFMDENGWPFFNPGSEHHWQYFGHAERLLPGLRKLFPGYSGISHHMIFQKCVLVDLFQRVEKIHSVPFWKAFCMKVDPKDRDRSGASEYEIYFNFIFSQSPQARCRILNWRNVSTLHEMVAFRESGLHYVSCHAYLRGIQ
jgi:hypothetical protein